MKLWRIPLLAALIAALFVLAPVAFADCPPGNPECELLPPESEEVNPDPGRGVGLAGEVASPGSFLPVQAVIPMPLPRLADASPGTVAVGEPASVPGIEIPLRYQNPDDVSCGVQALGMALDGLEGAAPTSSALLGFLQGNGMMYDFGTGVEELAYAAQSFGYRGSYAFHGATLEDLAAQLAAGSPVVVSLGANGEGVPGHFVTVTGISPDGKWVSYNDPTLGRQVISADEFTRLWGLQGNSGMAVLKEVPAGAPDYSPWVALMAGLMALVSMTPLGTKRSGIGGRVDSGGGGSKAKPAPKPAPKAAPKPAPKSAPKPAPAPAPKAAPKPAPAPAPAPRARFDEEPAPAPRPAPAPAPAPRPAPVATPAPRPPTPPQPAPSLFGLITSAVSSAVSTVSTAVQHTVSTVSNTVSRAVSTASTMVRDAVSTTVNRTAAFVGEVAEEARQMGRTVATTVSQAAAKVGNTVRTTAQSVGNTVRTAATAAVSTVQTVADRAAESLSNTARNVVVSALTAAHEAVTAATPIAQRIVAAPFVAAHDFVRAATPVSQAIVADALNAISRTVDHTSRHARMSLGWDELPPGMSRWDAAAETVFGLGDLATLGSLSDIRYGAQEGDYLRMGLGVIGVLPLGGLSRPGTALTSRLGMRALDGADDLLRVGRAMQVAGSHADEAARVMSAVDFGAAYVDEATGLARRQLFHNPSLSFSDSLPRGVLGATDRLGNMTISGLLPPHERALTIYHESVHSFFSARLSILQGPRGALIESVYGKSQLFRYAEEALAESYAQVMVNGLRGLPRGLVFPLTNDYGLSVPRILGEAILGAGGTGAVLYGAHEAATEVIGQVQGNSNHDDESD